MPVTLEPSRAVAVMVTFPALRKVTFPEYSSTVAVSSSPEVHFTSLFVAFEGVIVAVSASEPPVVSVVDVLFSLGVIKPVEK